MKQTKFIIKKILKYIWIDNCTNDSYNEENICCICFENKYDCNFNCGHNFCINCATEWTNKHNKNCPNCRKLV